jgi:MATE family multidrug resistance protein
MKIDRIELRAMLVLAAPLVLAELGWMAMGIEDTMFVGRIGAEAIGAISVGTTIFYTISILGGGLTLGLDTLVSQASGAGDLVDRRRSLVNGLWLTLALIPVVMLVVHAMLSALATFGVRPGVLRQVVPYMRTLNWSTPPLLLFFCLRRYLQAIGRPRPVMIALIAANVLNIAGNWVFVFGNLGAPRLGAVGSAWSTVLARTLMFTMVGIALLRAEPGILGANWRVDPRRIRELLKLGAPAAGQIGAEMLVWTIATVLAGRLAADSLAGHQIAMTTVSTTFMLPLGVSSAAAVRVGHAIGRGDPRGAAHAGWLAVGLGAALMSACGLVLITVPQVIARLFTPDVVIIAAAVPLLRLAAFFQLFDGVQVVTTGALRGAGNTATPMICHIVGYGVIGLPLGAVLCFREGLGAPGLWIGLSTGLILIGIALAAFWRVASRKIADSVHGTALATPPAN